VYTFPVSRTDDASCPLSQLLRSNIQLPFLEDLPLVPV
jgi:hypothetical protein